MRKTISICSSSISMRRTISRITSRRVLQSRRSRFWRTWVEKSAKRPITRVRSRRASAAAASAVRCSSNWAMRALRSATRGSNSIRSMSPSANPSISRPIPRRYLREPSPILVSAPLRIVQDRFDLGPHGALETVAAHRAIGAHRLSIEPVAIAADAAISAIAEQAGAMALRKPGRGLAVVGVATAPAHNEALEQPTGASALLSLAPPVLLKLGSGVLRDARIDKGRHRHRHPLGVRDRHARGRACGVGRMIADRTQPRFRLDRVEATVHGRAGVGGVLDHAMEGGRPPPRGARPAPASRLLEPAADLAQAQPVEPDPGEDQTDPARLLGHDLEAGHPAAPLARDVAVSIGRAGESADRTGARGMALSAPASLQDLGALVFRNHALDLKQQVVLRAGADGAVQEGDRDAGAPELLHQPG